MKGLRSFQGNSGSVCICRGSPNHVPPNQSRIPEKEKKFFKKTREAEEKADQEAAQESGPNDVRDRADP